MNSRDRSPYRSGQKSSIESLQISIRNLERENDGLISEINLLRTKIRTAAEIQEKMELVTRQNNQLLNENQRLSRLVSQKRSQTQLWKNKHDNLSVNRTSTTELQIKRLLNQIEKVKEQASQIQRIKNVQINQLKNQHHLELQNIKRSNLGSAEKYQLEIRKLKQYCDKKEYEISDLNMKIVRLKKQTDFEIGKLHEEKERLRNDLQFEEVQHRKEVESLKNKFDYNFHSQIQNMKKQHFNQIETLDYENSKLKEVIKSKNMEIEEIMNKHMKVKNNYEDSLSLLKKQNEELKDKIVENQHIADLELNNLRDKMEGIKESQIAMLRNAHANQCDLLNREILQLKEYLDHRTGELENMSKERAHMRNSLEGDLFKAKAALETQINQNREAAIRHEDNLKTCDEELQSRTEELETMQKHLKVQIESLSSQIKTCNKLLQQKQNQLLRQRTNFRKNQQELKDEVQLLKAQSLTYKEEMDRISRKSSSEIQDLNKIHSLKTQKLSTQILALAEENKEKENLISELKNNIIILQSQIKETDEKVLYLQNTQNDLRREAKENFSKWNEKQKQLNRMLKQQIQGMQRTKRNEINELNSIHDNKMKSMKHQIKELERHIEDKNRLLNDLKSQYEELVNKFEEIFGQRASQKNYDIKIPGWIPDTLAIKSLFDVFLKNKVLEYCS